MATITSACGSMASPFRIKQVVCLCTSVSLLDYSHNGRVEYLLLIGFYPIIRRVVQSKQSHRSCRLSSGRVEGTGVHLHCLFSLETVMVSSNEAMKGRSFRAFARLFPGESPNGEIKYPLCLFDPLSYMTNAHVTVSAQGTGSRSRTLIRRHQTQIPG